MIVAMVSRTLPAKCGIAEYTSMLGSALREFSELELVFLGNREEKEGLAKRYIEPYSGIETWICFSRNGALDGIVNCVKDLIRERGVNIVHIQHEYDIFPDNRMFLSLLTKLRELGIKIVVTMHTVVHALKGHEYVEFQRKVGELAHAIVVHSILQEYELIMQGVDPGKIHRIPHGTLINPFIGRSRSELLKTLGINETINDTSILITTPGFIRSDKGLALLLKAFSEVRKRYNATLVLIGTPQHDGKRYLTELLSDLHSLKDVVFVNRFLNREELLRLLAAMDIAVFPYRDELHLGVSGAFHMAIGSRKAVVCSKAPRLIECYEYAPELTVQTLDAHDIAKKIEMVIENPKIVNEAVERLWKYALNTNWHNIARLHRKLYYEVLEL